MCAISAGEQGKLSIFESDAGVKEYLLIDKKKQTEQKDISRKA
jgi:Uma2 family endonuclease